ncbi:hypothetical protein F383_08617 [Gossypium arboreum]|uniref:Uncharacterized protein n=1 Tax=Gossypium arboreum TaxID=29729 RepID=A0A0B0N7Y1_GOSAR|nr:hypothetical protein F383_08617 [Gossypium arboreum]
MPWCNKLGHLGPFCPGSTWVCCNGS